MNRNIEWKARCIDLDRALRIAGEIAGPCTAELAQTDTYFRSTEGRLKIRKTAGGAELIAYIRPDDAAARGSDYVVVPVDAGPLHEALASTLGVIGVVRKTRLLYIHDNVRIHIDRVEGLGAFIEFEAVVDDECTDGQAWAKVKELARRFSGATGAVVGSSYSDLLGFGRRGAGEAR